MLLTAAGATYNISFLFRAFKDEPDNNLKVQVGSLNSTLDLVRGTWASYSGTFTASSNSTPLDFLFSTTPGNGLVSLDNVVVSEAASVRSVTEEVPEAVPVPLPPLGAGAAFVWSRKLRRRIDTATIAPPQA
jgi:hypothetical protein